MNENDPVKVLLVDDRPENLLALESVLDSPEVTLVSAASGDQALRRLLKEEYAVILLDVQMPGMDGYQTARMIRGRGRSAHIPIVFLTAVNTSDLHVTEGYLSGAVDYVLKPFQPEALRAKVMAFVDMYKKRRELKLEVERRQRAEAEVRKLNAELERRVHERTRQLETANEELRRSHARIEGLNWRLREAMKETHHRVKNNLQIIAAMVDMELMDGEGFIPSDDIRRLGSQVRTLAAVHDILTQESSEREAGDSVSARAILVKLIALLEEATPSRQIEHCMDEVKLTSKQSTTLALVVNELVCNALKHGNGIVEVVLRVVGDSAELTVLDDGPGFPAGFSPIGSAHTGLELIDNLSRWDLGGQVQFNNRPGGGAAVTVVLPIASPLAAVKATPRSQESGARAART